MKNFKENTVLKVLEMIIEVVKKHCTPEQMLRILEDMEFLAKLTDILTEESK